MSARARSSSATADYNARATHCVQVEDITRVLTHRRVNGSEEYLVRWRPLSATSSLRDAPCSWHTPAELWDALQHVQTYLEARPRARGTLLSDQSLLDLPPNRKRKSPGAHPAPSRDNGSKGDILKRSRSYLVRPTDSVLDSDEEDEQPRVFNAVLSKREGRLIAKQVNRQLCDVRITTIDATTLPTAAMIEVASKTPVKQAEYAIRTKFLEMLHPVKGVTLENGFDSTTPSLNFTFIPDYVFSKEIPRPAPDSYEGCTKCRPDMGQGIGCEYTQLCGCLEYAAVDEQRLPRYPELHRKYLAARENGDYLPDGLPKRFPYSAPSKDDPAKPQKLVGYYLGRRHPIYECNRNCRCGPGCKSRLVQKGRRVPLTIFKTRDRGWGVKCSEPLIRGEFIDTYVGEVITSAEADSREEEAGPEKDSYLYTLNKFASGDFADQVGAIGLSDEDCYVVDGQYKGGPTRFINHSCEPNCRQYTVHYNKNDFKLYTLAFFAYEDIPAGTELTFDYRDEDEQEEEDAIRRREEALRDPANRDKTRCNCGSRKCRGFLW